MVRENGPVASPWQLNQSILEYGLEAKDPATLLKLSGYGNTMNAVLSSTEERWDRNKINQESVGMSGMTHSLW